MEPFARTGEKEQMEPHPTFIPVGNLGYNITLKMLAGPPNPTHEHPYYCESSAHSCPRAIKVWLAYQVHLNWHYHQITTLDIHIIIYSGWVFNNQH